jgi:hypothetical protein
MKKIALYTCNFGNYRNEFKQYTEVTFNDNIDYFIFTDKVIENNRLNKWKICNIDMINDNTIMPKNRLNSKYVKFVLPNELKDYDIIVWMDNRQMINMYKFKYENIIKLVELYPNYDLFNLKHNERTTIKEELIETIRLKYENIEPAKQFLEKIKDYKSNFLLPDTSIIIRKNNKIINDAFKYCYDGLIEYKLKRDQNVYNYIMDRENVLPYLFKTIDEFAQMAPLALI